MKNTALLFSSIVVFSALGAALAAGCSSSNSTPSCQSGQTVACQCAGSNTFGTQLCGAATCDCSGGTGLDGSSPSDSSTTPPADTGTTSPDAGTPPEGDGGHQNDGAPPSTLYGACAADGGFGWPCGSTQGNNPTICTDPNYPYCFVGGQGSWCTKPCTATGTECTTNVEDAGCVPTQCNARGYCK